VRDRERDMNGKSKRIRNSRILIASRLLDLPRLLPSRERFLRHLPEPYSCS